MAGAPNVSWVSLAIAQESRAMIADVRDSGPRLFAFRDLPQQI